MGISKKIVADNSITYDDLTASPFGTLARDTFYTDASWREFRLAAKGVDTRKIGVCNRQIRGSGDSFPAVSALIALLQDVRAVLGPSCKISYAADWSEYSSWYSRLSP